MTQAKFDPSNVPATYVATQAICVYSFTAAAERQIARDVKEKLRYSGVDYDTELKSTAETDKEKTFELPDRNIISVGAECFHCVDTLFQPSFFRQRSQRIPRHFFPVQHEVRL